MKIKYKEPYWVKFQWDMSEHHDNQYVTSFDKEENPRPIGWIFRRNLDYVSLDYVNGDRSRKFLWSCEITTSEQLNIRIENKLNAMIINNFMVIKLVSCQFWKKRKRQIDACF